MASFDNRQAYEQLQRARMLQAAMIRQAKLMKKAQSDAARLAVADQARADGDLSVAIRLYVGLASTRTPSPATMAARQRLEDVRTEAAGKYSDLESRLTELKGTSASEQDDQWGQKLVACITELEQLADQYERVPRLGRELTSALNKEKRRPSAKALLCEPDAHELWETGQQLEAQGEVCCAMHVYEEALRLLPAASARTAQQRLEELRLDPKNVAAAEACRTLQECHRKYRLAERLLRDNPDKARVLFAEIVELAPADSSVSSSAQEQLAQLP